MTTTAWADLPNAAHIDRVLASAKATPKHRALAWDTTWSAERTVALNVARGLLIKQGRYWVLLEVPAVRDATRCALLALFAYDDCAYMLDSDPGELAILAAFGDPRALLLLPACKAFHSLT